MRLGWIIALAAMAFVPMQSATAAEAAQNDRFARVYGPSLAPIGYRAFCDRHPSDCKLPQRTSRTHLTPQRWDDLETINLIINRTIRPVTDKEQYGYSEVWTYPTHAGDCEDYVLLKRRMLLKRGWPASALLITVVRDELGGGHAVLLARTTSGDFVLDNRLDDVVAWHAMPYDFIKRQSAVNPMYWVSMTPNSTTVFPMLGETR
ncbi:MAG: transglutaminase-like cysteine peptidase [Planctomycetota bacterium]